MNVYEKVNLARVKLQSLNISKGGYNKYSGYYYYDLPDFLPSLNTILNDLKLFTYVSFDNEKATLRILNCEKPDEVIEIASPMSTAELKGCHEVQNLGAVETYERRYLYMTAFEVSDGDVLDLTQGKDPLAGGKNDNSTSNNPKPQKSQPVGNEESKKPSDYFKVFSELAKSLRDSGDMTTDAILEVVAKHNNGSKDFKAITDDKIWDSIFVDLNK